MPLHLSETHFNDTGSIISQAETRYEGGWEGLVGQSWAIPPIQLEINCNEKKWSSHDEDQKRGGRWDDGE